MKAVVLFRVSCGSHKCVMLLPCRRVRMNVFLSEEHVINGFSGSFCISGKTVTFTCSLKTAVGLLEVSISPFNLMFLFLCKGDENDLIAVALSIRQIEPQINNKCRIPPNKRSRKMLYNCRNLEEATAPSSYQLQMPLQQNAGYFSQQPQQLSLLKCCVRPLLGQFISNYLCVSNQRVTITL